MKFLFDTSAWIEYALGTERGGKVKTLIENENILTPDLALIELSCKAEKEKWDFKKLLKFIMINSAIVKYDYSKIHEFGRLYLKAKSMDGNISLVDVIIATISSQQEAKLITKDKALSKIADSVLI